MRSRAIVATVVGAGIVLGQRRSPLRPRLKCAATSAGTASRPCARRGHQVQMNGTPARSQIPGKRAIRPDILECDSPRQGRIRPGWVARRKRTRTGRMWFDPDRAPTELPSQSGRLNPTRSNDAPAWPHRSGCRDHHEPLRTNAADPRLPEPRRFGSRPQVHPRGLPCRSSASRVPSGPVHSSRRDQADDLDRHDVPELQHPADAAVHGPRVERPSPRQLSSALPACRPSSTHDGHDPNGDGARPDLACLPPRPAGFAPRLGIAVLRHPDHLEYQASWGQGRCDPARTRRRSPCLRQRGCALHNGAGARTLCRAD